MALQVKGKTALVTGGGSGICLEFTKVLLSNGCNVVIADLALRPEAEEIIKKGIGATGGPKAIFQETDVTSWDQLQAAFDISLKTFGRLDIVCPGAGLFEPTYSNLWNLLESSDTNASSSYKTLEVNITHPIRATQLAIDSFIRQKLGHGVVVNISSIAAQIPLITIPLYVASKSAISGFTRTLAMLEPQMNIRVNAVAPGIVKTPIWTADKLSWVDEEVDSWVTAERVAQVMLDLVQNPNYVGGTVLEVGVDVVRKVQLLNDPGTQGNKGHSVAKIGEGIAGVFDIIQGEFGK